jgi:hypothetical protein
VPTSLDLTRDNVLKVAMSVDPQGAQRQFPL